MSKTTIVVKPDITPNAVGNVRQALSRLGSGDEITITVESTDAHQADSIISLLEAGGFDYQPKGSHDGKSYFINARKQ